MERCTLAGLFILIVLILPWSVAGVHAASLNYSVHDGKVTVDLALHFYQNATSMPILDESLGGLAAEELTRALDGGVKQRAPQASVSSLAARLGSTESWINATIGFEIAAASVRKGDLLSVDCSWVPVKISRDLKLGNLSYNLIGSTYVRSWFEAHINYTQPPLNETISEVKFFSGDDEIPGKLASEKAGNATLLSFGLFDTPIDHWKRGYNLTKDLTTWTYDPGPAVDLTMRIVPREGNPSVSRTFYHYNASISAQGLAQAEGNTITLDVEGALKPLLMLVVVVVTFLGAVIVSSVYRSRRRQFVRKRR